ncbi:MULTISPECIES: alpha/beta fold hydrolase [unclassified Streptomyces]|uniref:Alpha/beta fold hydrolase n=1 Tax=Streptomyces sp. R33 TaxID=3238629 RepID=A0AB39YCE6_9ACTN|nr:MULTISPECIES: alpha/beta hydrolase [unclassified Streptomyces]KJY28583.1 alpha/beta hydrolase [Streptomyces sp. NRRL S-444]KOY56978.1 alpha/beta hydrolase [Streptomyces sp. XY332]TDU79780.1 pimeloyl-ACP methyl ester carboxylesterase [Streptomyces sp. KS 21]
MSIFNTHDGTALAYHVQGEGEPLVCLPGGAMRASAYLGDLGGLSAGRRLVRLDLRGTGDSAIPADESTYRVDHQVADVEALRVHLGLERMDVLAHSAGGNLAQLYAAAHPDRVRRLVLVTPTCWAVGLDSTPAQRLEVVRKRAGGEPYDTAIAAYERILGILAAGATPTPADWRRTMPLAYGRWDAEARAHVEASDREKNAAAGAAYAGPGAFDPPATRAGLRRVAGEVLVLAGELDSNPTAALAAELAGLFPHGAVDVQAGGAHFPWLDDPQWFAARVERFLDEGV